MPPRRLQSYAPATVNVLVTETALLAADSNLRIAQLTNKGTVNVWYCHAGRTPVVGSGFFIPPHNGSVTLTGDNTPVAGLKAIADGATAAVAVGRG